MEGNYHFAVLAGRKTDPFGLGNASALQPAGDANSPDIICSRQRLQGSLGLQLAACTHSGKASLRFISIESKRSLAPNLLAFAKQVLVYCFRERKCGTFMPLSCFRRESRIAVVWTWFSAVFSAIPSGPFRVLFTRWFVLTVVDCG